MEHEKKASTRSTVGAATGITSLGLIGLSALSGGGGVLPNLFGARPVAAGYPAGTTITVDASGNPVASCGCYVTKENLSYVREINAKDSEISLLKSEKYTSEFVGASLAPVYAKLNEQEKEICSLKADLAMESERRACGDEKLLTYVESNYLKAEKSLNSKKINYHGVKPTLVIDECCCDA